MFPDQTQALARAVLDLARRCGWRIGAVESCTGGLVAAALTEIAGSSDVVEGGLVTYSNALKTRLVGVHPSLLVEHGAVSEPVARAMAEGALQTLDVEVAVAITGVAGPGGGSPDKPVGLVHFAVATRDGATRGLVEHFGDIGRAQVRQASVDAALKLLIDRLSDER